MSVLVAVTDHAAERFRQRVGSRTGSIDVKPEVVTRVAKAFAADRVTQQDDGTVLVRDLVDRGVVFVCRRDGAELLVITLWENEGSVAGPKVPKRFTDALRDDDEPSAEARRRAREDRG